MRHKGSNIDHISKNIKNRSYFIEVGLSRSTSLKMLFVNLQEHANSNAFWYVLFMNTWVWAKTTGIIDSSLLPNVHRSYRLADHRAMGKVQPFLDDLMLLRW